MTKLKTPAKKTRIKQDGSRWWAVGIALILGVVLVMFPPGRIHYLDDLADQYFQDSIVKASGAYAVARIINAGVTVVKGSSLELGPGGVGVSVAVGEVADPLNDLVEKVSAVLVTAIVSLMVQKITYEIAQVYLFQIIGVVLLIVAVFSLFRSNAMILSYRNLLIKIAVFLAVVRLFLPCSALISNKLNEDLFFPRIESQHQKLEPMLRDLKGITDFDVPEVKGVSDMFATPVRMMTEKGKQLNMVLTLLAVNGLQIFNSLIAIMALYLGIFAIQVVFLPIMMFWLLNKLVYILFSHTLPQFAPLPMNGTKSKPSPPPVKLISREEKV